MSSSRSIFLESGSSALAANLHMLHVCVNPSVLFSIMDAHSRRPEKTDRVIGTLLGSSSDGIVTVRGCFTVPFSESEDEVKVEMDFHRQMFALHHRASPKDHVVGWFSTGSQVSDISELIHQFYSPECGGGEPIHLVVSTDTLVVPGSGLQVKGYVCPSDQFDRPMGPHFREIACSVVADEYDRAALDIMLRGEGEREGGLGSMAESLKSVVELITKSINYVQSVVDGKVKGDPKIGRALASAVSQVPKVDAQEFNAALTSSMQDLVMVAYLSDLARTQLEIAEKLAQIH